MKTADDIEFDTPQEGIGKLLKNIGYMLEEIDREPSDELTLLHDNLDAIADLAEKEEEPNLQYLVFFLNKFEKDLWDNIAMTSSKRIKDKYIIRVLQDLAPHFKAIGDSILTGTYDDCYEEYVGMVETYFDKTKNKEFQEIIQ